jgi:hypothetical protein
LALPNQTIRKANRDLNGSTKGAKATEDGEAQRASNPSVSATSETSGKGMDRVWESLGMVDKGCGSWKLLAKVQLAKVSK